MDPSPPKIQRKDSIITGNKPLSQCFDHSELLQLDEDSDHFYLCVTTYSEVELILLVKAQNPFPLSLLLTAFFEAHWFDVSGHYGQDRTYSNFKLCFFPRVKEMDWPVKNIASHVRPVELSEWM